MNNTNKNTMENTNNMTGAQKVIFNATVNFFKTNCGFSDEEAIAEGFKKLAKVKKLSSQVAPFERLHS